MSKHRRQRRPRAEPQYTLTSAGAELALMFARVIAEDMAREQGGTPEYWMAWIKQEVCADRLMLDISPDGKGVRLIPVPHDDKEGSD